MSIQRVIIFLTFILLISAGVYFSLQERHYHFIYPEERTVIDAVYGTGTFSPDQTVTISPESSGLLMSFQIKENDSVKKDQLLAVLDDQMIAATLKRNMVLLEYAKNNFLRISKLYEKHSISSNEFEQAKKDYLVAQTNLEIDKIQLAKTKILSPANGLVMKLDAEPGDYLTQGKPFIYLWNTDKPLQLVVDIDERDIPKIQPNQKVLITTDAYTGRVFTGSVNRIDQMGNADTHNYAVYVVLTDASAFYVGMSAEVNIIVAEKMNAMVLPISSVNGQSVWVHQNNQAVKIPVTTGIRNQDFIEITGGIDLNAKVLIDLPPSLNSKEKISAILQDEKKE